MPTVSLLQLASKNARWLSARQTTIAGNIANANTPGYRSADLEPFSAILDRTRARLTTTSPGHLTEMPGRAAATERRPDDAWEIQHSGNSVSLDQELVKASEVKGAFALNTSIVKSFNRMLLASSKG